MDRSTAMPSFRAPQRRLSQPEQGSSPFLGRVTRQQSVPSASPLKASPSRTSSSSQLASARYVKQFHTLMDSQRQAFDEERALWNTERLELHQKILLLETSLRRYQALSSSQVSSPIDKTTSSQSGSFWSSISTNGSRHTSAGTTEDKVWCGSNPDVQPTRTFSDSSNPSLKMNDRLPSIAEDIKQDSSNQYVNGTGKHKSRINGINVDQNLDGINFKPTSLAPAIKSTQSTSSSSPQHSPSPSRASPNTIPLPYSFRPDSYTKDAGHTPLARFSANNHSGQSSAKSSDIPTPTQEEEQERPPLEPHVTEVKVRPPSERHDSYFPPPPTLPPAQQQVVEQNLDNEDPELQGPLSLTDDAEGNSRFLGELDAKLLHAADSINNHLLRSAEIEAKDNGTDGGNGTGENKENGGPTQKEAQDKEEKNFDQPEHEPPLRIKRSINFGSQLGTGVGGRAF